MKRIGLLFGSFNPPHIGHLALANYILEYAGRDEIWFIVSPHNPLKEASELVDEDIRLDMVSRSIFSEPRFKASAYEFSLPRPSYTIDTLDSLAADFPDCDFSLIIGSDNYLSLDKWKDKDRLVRDYKLLVYPRFGFPIACDDISQNVKVVKAPRFEISSTMIREAIRQNKSIRFWLPCGIYDYILERNLYK